MKKFISIVLFFCFVSSLTAQKKDTITLNGTIKVQRKGQLAKVQFDNINYRLIGIDQYGNPIDSAVVEFQLSATIRGVFYSEKMTGSMLSSQMQQLLGKCDRTTKLFFTKIIAKDRSGNLIEMPKFNYVTGFAEENNE